MANYRICSIPDCGKTVLNVRGWCSKHYQRWRKHGDPLGGPAFRTSRGDSLRFVYEVVLNHHDGGCLNWPFCKVEDGYGRIWSDGKNGLAHRYVCELVNGPPPTRDHEAAHTCGNGHLGCVAPGHLSWKTKADNQADRLFHGTHDRGERSANSKISESDAREILSLRGTLSQREIGQRFGVSQAQISRILRGYRWAWLE